MCYSKTLLALVTGSLMAVPAIGNAEDPYALPDNSYISISGTVANPTADSFMLDYGDGVITVEMDDWDSYGDAYGLMDGDKVTVYGDIDDDLYEIASIEAGAVYVENLNTYFYASSDDEEGVSEGLTYWTVSAPIVVSETVVRGTVTSVDHAEEQFTVDTATQQLTIEIEGLGYNPLDELGYQQVEVGDRVSVTGDINYEFFDGRVLHADSVITLSDASQEEDTES